jgi:tRNA/rRNA methyltransferase
LSFRIVSHSIPPVFQKQLLPGRDYAMVNEIEPELPTIVLCRVEGAMNVGAACRAMKSMGLTRLVFASCPEYDEVEVRTHALHAFDVYLAAARYADLGTALAEYSYAAGFTRRKGQRRKESLAVDTFAASLAGSGTQHGALVFGNERDGLSDAELALCDDAVSIPSSEMFPSLNLSHAVQIACWELRKAFQGRLPGLDDVLQAERQPALREASGAGAKRIADALSDAGFFKIAGRPEIETFLRSIVARAGLSEAELGRFVTLFVKLGALAGRGGRDLP